jgi:hypothetical protein
MRTSPYGNNPRIIFSWVLSCFIEKKYFHGKVGTYKIGGAPLA